MAEEKYYQTYEWSSAQWAFVQVCSGCGRRAEGKLDACPHCGVKFESRIGKVHNRPIEVPTTPIAPMVLPKSIRADKSVSKSSNLEIAEEPAVKRGRGRPRKIKTSNLPPMEAQLQDTYDSAVAEALYAALGQSRSRRTPGHH